MNGLPARMYGSDSAAWTRPATCPAIASGLGGRQIAQEHDELVAGEPRHDVVRPGAPVQAGGDLAQELVPGGVAHRVVHPLEAVDVEEEQPRGGRARGVDPGQRLTEALLEVRPVRQAGQAVVEGEVLHGLLAPLAVGDVGDEGVEDRPVAGADRPQRHLGDELAAVAAPGAHLGARAEAGAIAGLAVARHRGGRRLTVGERELRERHADRLLGLPSEELLGGPVPLHHGALGVGGDERVAGRRDDRPRPLLALTHPLLDPAAAGDVGVADLHADLAAVAVEHRGARARAPALDVVGRDDPKLGAGVSLALPQPGPERPHPGGVVGMHAQPLVHVAGGVLGAPAGQALERRGRVEQLPAHVEEEDDVGQVLDDQPPQRVVAAVGKLAQGGDVAGDGAVRVDDRYGAERRLPGAAVHGGQPDVADELQATGDGLEPLGEHRVAVVLVQRVDPGSAAGILVRDSRQLRPPLVHPGAGAGGIGVKDPDRGDVEQPVGSVGTAHGHGCSSGSAVPRRS